MIASFLSYQVAGSGFLHISTQSSYVLVRQDLSSLWPSMSMALCEDCTAFDIRKLDLKGGTGLQHKASFAALQVSAIHYPLCQLFRDETAKGKVEEKGDGRVTIAGIKHLSAIKVIEIQCQGRKAQLDVYFEGQYSGA
jgi:hypothetical protein